MDGRQNYRSRWVAAIALTGGAALAFTVSAYGSCPAADQEAVQWLDKMSRTASEASYQGVVTLQRGSDLQVMQLSHSVGGDTESEQLTRLTGQGARIERNRHPLDCVHPGHQLLRLSSALQEGACGVAEHYRFKVGEGGRVAGRHAVRILVEPRDLYRYGYVLDLDHETGLLLKARMVGRGNTTLELFQFAKLSYGLPDLDDESSELVVEAPHPADHDHPQLRAVDDSALPRNEWFVSWLPEGFMPTAPATGPGASRSYTDGLAVFSIFLEELQRDMQPGEGVVRQGGTISYTRGKRLGSAPVLITVIGEVPINTARMVVESVGWAR